MGPLEILGPKASATAEFTNTKMNVITEVGETSTCMKTINTCYTTHNHNKDVSF